MEIDNSSITLTDSDFTQTLSTPTRESRIITFRSNSNDKINLIRCDFSASGSLEYDGGALWIMNADTVLDNCTFTRNKGLNGGAIFHSCFNDFCSLTVDECTFTRNQAAEEGGGIKFTHI